MQLENIILFKDQFPQRYKMLGNGWTIEVIAHILKNMECDNEKKK